MVDSGREALGTQILPILEPMTPYGIVVRGGWRALEGLLLWEDREEEVGKRFNMSVDWALKAQLR